MKTFAFDTGALPRVLTVKRVFWVDRGQTYEKVLLVSAPAPIGATLTEIDDGTEEHEIREAIQAAAIACDWALAYEIVTRYGLSACIRCAADVSQRPTWRAHRFGIKDNWGEVCGECAVKFVKDGFGP